MMEMTKKGLMACAITWAVMALLWIIVLVKRLREPEVDWTYISLITLTILAGIVNVVIYVRRMKK